MISISQLKASTKGSTYIIGEIRGLSTDTKPTKVSGKTEIDGKEVSNGCVFIEMDTSKVYFYDAQNDQWKEF